MMATYVTQRKENFTRKLESKALRKCGVSILTNQKVLVVSYQVFNYFGMHNYLTYLCFYFGSIDPRVFDEECRPRTLDTTVCSRNELAMWWSGRHVPAWSLAQFTEGGRVFAPHWAKLLRLSTRWPTNDCKEVSHLRPESNAIRTWSGDNNIRRAYEAYISKQFTPASTVELREYYEACSPLNEDY